MKSQKEYKFHSGGDPGRAVCHMQSAFGEKPPSSILIFDLSQLCSSKSLEIGTQGSRHPPPKFDCGLESEEDLVWSLPMRFKASLWSSSEV